MHLRGVATPMISANKPYHHHMILYGQTNYILKIYKYILIKIVICFLTIHIYKMQFDYIYIILYVYIYILYVY